MTLIGTLFTEALVGMGSSANSKIDTLHVPTYLINMTYTVICMHAFVGCFLIQEPV